MFVGFSCKITLAPDGAPTVLCVQVLSVVMEHRKILQFDYIIYIYILMYNNESKMGSAGFVVGFHRQST